MTFDFAAVFDHYGEAQKEVLLANEVIFRQKHDPIPLPCLV